MSAGVAWERVVRAALLGTERQAETDAATGDAELDAAVAALADRPAEARLLGTAALLDAWRRAGRRASVASAPPEPAPEDDGARPASPLAARLLRQAMAENVALVGEWLTLARNAGVGLPHDLLPEVLHLGRRYSDTRAQIAAALGPRGRWLAALNPDWSYAVAVPDEPASGAATAEERVRILRRPWETGTAEERVRILRHVRAADPAAGLALLRSTWETDPPKDRAAFVEALETGLGMDDEPFLESALDDKRKEVRTAAAALLSALPGSRFVARMTERLVPLLTLHAPEGMLARIRGAAARIQVQLPAACDKGMRRDGVEPKPPHGIGERAWWLRQMVAAVPPPFWTAHWDRPAAELLAAAQAGEDGDTLVGAWMDAAVRARDADWAEALLRTAAHEEPIGIVHPLAAVLPADRLEPLVLERIGAHRLGPTNTAAQMLQVARFAWSPALTRAVLAHFPSPLTPVDYFARDLLRVAAPYLHPATAVAVLREQGDVHEGPWVDLLHLRATLHQAFS